MFSIIESGKKEKEEIVACFQFLAILENNGTFFYPRVRHRRLPITCQAYLQWNSESWCHCCK